MISTNEQLLHLLNHSPAEIQGRLKRRMVQEGKELISPGDPPDRVYVVRSGLVKVYILEANGKEFSLAFLGKGELIGEVELFLAQPFACIVEALQETDVYCLSKRLFLDWMERDRTLNMLVLKEMAFRLYSLTIRTSFQMLYPIEYAMMKILYLSQEENIGITKTDLADYLGITIRSLNRSLNRLKAKDILLFSDNTLRIQSKDKLKQELMRYEYA